MKYRALVGLIMASAVAGCAHQLTLTPADGVGPIGVGSASGGTNKGALTIDYGGKRYTGSFVNQEAGFMGIGTAYGIGGVSTATMLGTSGQGGGKAYLVAEDGSSLSCDFSFSSWSSTGVGFCRGSDGKTFNLMIH